MRSSCLFAIALFVAAGCDTFWPPPPDRCTEDDVDTAALPNSDAPVWHRDVRPIVLARCTRCHQDGGIGPFTLTSYDDAYDRRAAIQRAVVDRVMPPWLAAPCCRAYLHDVSLTPAQIATISRWVDDGAREGDPSDVGPALPAVVGLPRVDVEVEMPDAYQPVPPAGKDDDFRCFILPWPQGEPTFVTGFDIVPGDHAQVHHAIVFIAEPGQVQGFVDDDGRDDAPGWSCPGGFIFGVEGYVGGWAPGRDGNVVPADHGHAIAPGSALLLAMHYARHDGSDFVEDRTRIELMVDDDVGASLQSVWIYNGWWPAGTMNIPRGARDVRHAVQIDATDYYSAWSPITVFAAAFHMHEHGTRGFLGVRRADGTEECLVQIDRWNPDWQTDFEFEEPVVLQHGDQIFIECFFDNNEDHDLNWGEDDEMCIAFLTAEGDRL